MSGKITLFSLMLFLALVCSCKKPEQYQELDQPIDSLQLVLPNAFSPNNDGINESYKVIHAFGSFRVDSPTLFVKAKNNPLKGFEMEIRDLENHVLFYTQNIDEGWDGKVKDKLAGNGQYHAYIHVEGKNGGIKNRNQSIMLTR